MLDEGHSAAGWVWATDRAAPPTASAGQYATSNCKLFGYPRKWRYINVEIFDHETLDYEMKLKHTIWPTLLHRSIGRVGSGVINIIEPMDNSDLRRLVDEGFNIRYYLKISFAS